MNNLLLNKIRIVLVETSHPGNIGSAARAMKTMGLTDLCLVNPKTFPSEEAIKLASNAGDVLDSATVVSTLEEAILDCQFILGTSSRKRYLQWPLIDSRIGAEEVAQAAKSDQQIAIIFGNERTGLTNEQLQVCHKHVTIPTISEYASLNLAQAVQVMAYECHMAMLSVSDELSNSLNQNNIDNKDKDPLATEAQMQGFYQHLEEALTHINFVNPHEKTPPMRRLKRLFQRAQCLDSEVNILRGVCKKILQQ